MSKLIIGALAHVDAGKTTLSEAILYKTGAILNIGRVDKRNTFLDYNIQEKERGITIFNKEARFTYKNKDYIYVDTPGHNEFKSEAFRAYHILDLALLIVNGSEKIHNDDILKFNTLIELGIPLIIFVNKEDNLYGLKEDIVKDIRESFNDNCVSESELFEHVALSNETLLESYLENNTIKKEAIISSIASNQSIPILFGSALKDIGIDNLLNFIDSYIEAKSPQNVFSAYVYGISNDGNQKLCHMKILGGALNNKTSFNGEKINEIRLYNGKNYIGVQSVTAGDLCAVTGLNNISIGTYLPSFTSSINDETLSLTYEIKSNIDNNELYRKINVLNSEQPELHITLKSNHLFIDLKGNLHKQIIYNQIKERFNVEISFLEPIIVYKESIKKASFGVGHFEPLRHYAEVIVELRPSNKLSFNTLVNNSFTGPMITYLNQSHPKGILTNSELCNMSITIVDIKTHPKHTEGGDLIEALRRAIRHALHFNDCFVLEPFYIVNIEAKDNVNIIINVLNSEQYSFTINENTITCKINLKKYNQFILNLRSKLKDALNYEIIEKVYDEAINQEDIIIQKGYDYKSDYTNPTGSIFTFHGAGHYIDVEEVIDKMHLNLNDYLNSETTITKYIPSKISEDELNRVWNSLYKPKKRTAYNPKNIDEEKERIDISIKPLIYVIDGYNLMYSLEELKDIVKTNFIMAREKVIDFVSDFKGYVNARVILVFDAYKQNYSAPQLDDNGIIEIVYTKALQTADTYIENVVKKLNDKYRVITVTSDYLEQLGVLSSDSIRLSCKELINRYNNMKRSTVSKTFTKNQPLLELKKLLEEN